MCIYSSCIVSVCRGDVPLPGRHPIRHPKVLSSHVAANSTVGPGSEEPSLVSLSLLRIEWRVCQLLMQCSTHFIDTLAGITTIRALGWVQDSIRVNSHLLDTSQRPAYLLAMIQRWLGFMLQLIVAVLALVVVTLATQLGSGTAVTGASLVTLMSFGEGLSIIVTMYTMLETSIGAVSRLKSFGDKVKPEDLEDEDINLPPEWPDRGHVVLSGVSASYL